MQFGRLLPIACALIAASTSVTNCTVPSPRRWYAMPCPSTTLAGASETPEFRDVYSTRARLGGGIETIPWNLGRQREEWLECLTDNRRTPVPDQVLSDQRVSRWLVLRIHQSQIAETLALGYSTAEAARKFNISAARVSQIRRELYESWNEFTGERQPVSAGKCHTKVAPAN